MKALLGYHCFSGCDSISSFTGRGKLKPLNLLLSSVNYITAFASLGVNNIVSDELAIELEKFVCHMYGMCPINSDVNVNSTVFYLLPKEWNDFV